MPVPDSQLAPRAAVVPLAARIGAHSSLGDNSPRHRLDARFSITEGKIISRPVFGREVRPGGSRPTTRGSLRKYLITRDRKLAIGDPRRHVRAHVYRHVPTRGHVRHPTTPGDRIKINRLASPRVCSTWGGGRRCYERFPTSVS